MAKEPTPLPFIYDSMVNWTMGVDSSKHPNLIPQGYSSFGVNVTFRGGKPKNRPAFKELVIPEQEHKALLQYGRHQGDTIYQNLQDDSGFMISIRSGWVLKIDLTTLQITKLDSTQNDTNRRHYFCQADKYLVIQNGVDIPLIFDGSTIRRAHCAENNPGVTNTNITQNLGVATVTTATPHGLHAGEYIALQGSVSPAGYIGNYRVAAVVDEYTYKIKVTSNLTSPATDPGTTYRPMELPIGLFMEYVMGRLVVVKPDRREMRVGDLIRTTPDTFSTESVLWFTDEQFLAESYIFTLPASQGRIRSVAAIPFMGSPTGQGDLLISGDKGLTTLSLAYPRNEWLSKPIQKMALTGVAVASQIGQIGYNGDIIFRDLEYGIRTFRLADAVFSKSPSQTPISSELNRVFLDDDRDKLQFTSMIVFDNRLITTVTPVFEERATPVTSISRAGNTATINYTDASQHQVGDRLRLTNTTGENGRYFTITAVNSTTSVDVDATGSAITNQGAGGFMQSPRTGAEYYHKGLSVMDYTTLSGAQGATQAAWDGVWTGLNTQMINKAYLSGAPKCILSVYNDNLHRNEFWEITTKQGKDVGEFGESLPTCWVETASMSCQKPFSQKRLQRLSLFLHDIRGNVIGNIYYRNDGDQCWTPWQQSPNQEAQLDICANAETNPTSETKEAVDGMQQALPQRRLVRVGQPQRACEVTTSADSRLFYETQVKFEWTGLLTLDKLELMAIEQIQDTRGGCR